MVKHDCLKEADIAQLKTTVDRIDKVVEGNGHEGLNLTTVRLEETVKGLQNALYELKDSMNAFRTMASGFEKFQVEYTVLKVSEAKHETRKRWMVGTVISMGSLLIAVIAYLFKRT